MMLGMCQCWGRGIWRENNFWGAIEVQDRSTEVCPRGGWDAVFANAGLPCTAELYSPCFQVCLLLVKPHTGCSRWCTRTLVGTASQRHRRDLYYNTALETWPLVPLPNPTGAPAAAAAPMFSAAHSNKVAANVSVRVWTAASLRLCWVPPAVFCKV